ncbi:MULTISPECIES: hypothetical protein [Providencia]|uniref:hypothetical protein n=1 Tax=Providencia TaxID=586 RepID=UPI000D9071C7|nr:MULTISPECIES: hypothetical protein [Providencia]MDH2366878.1 hypothetical protein [Providencia rettgeri]PYZ60007.1 hypothetical protein DNK63_13210 [Providencia rettgeri]QIF65406.1 hypothetical protein FVA72_07650 [Providencia sp. 1709051003]WOB96617.1 hypothetical protein P3L54_07335 [Providencia sp. PROV099]
MYASLYLSFMLGSVAMGTNPVSTYNDMETCKQAQSQLTVAGTKGMSIKSTCRETPMYYPSGPYLNGILAGGKGTQAGKTPPYSDLHIFEDDEYETCVGAIKEVAKSMENEPAMHAVFFCVPVQKKV